MNAVAAVAKRKPTTAKGSSKVNSTSAVAVAKGKPTTAKGKPTTAKGPSNVTMRPYLKEKLDTETLCKLDGETLQEIKEFLKDNPRQVNSVSNNKRTPLWMIIQCIWQKNPIQMWIYCYASCLLMMLM